MGKIMMTAAEKWAEIAVLHPLPSRPTCHDPTRMPSSNLSVIGVRERPIYSARRYKPS